MSYSGGSGPWRVGRASSSAPTVPPGSGHYCSAVTTVTSARNCSGAPTTPESTSPWTAGSPELSTKHSESALAASIGGSTNCWKISPKRRLLSAPSRCSPNQHRLKQDDLHHCAATQPRPLATELLALTAW